MMIYGAGTKIKISGVVLFNAPPNKPMHPTPLKQLSHAR
jgi:hypothetical protein